MEDVPVTRGKIGSKIIKTHIYLRVLIPLGIVILSNILFYFLVAFTAIPDVLIVYTHIFMTSGGLLLYYISLYNKNHMRKGELIFMMLIVYLITIGIFANYYSVPCTEGDVCMTVSGVPTDLSYFDALYYSTGTITSAGTGDIVAKSVFHRSLAMFEMMLGPIYMGLILYYVTKDLK